MSQRGRPQTQVKLTNVAVVRLKRAGKRFEVACYKNKIVNWRNGVEDNIEEVLQTDEVFTNVVRGETASRKQLDSAFGVESSTDDIIRFILKKGEMQISDKERKHSQDAMFQEVANIVTSLCVNPDNGRPYPVSLIKRSMRANNFNINPAKSAKVQALKCIKLLKANMRIQRAKMLLRLRVSAVTSSIRRVKAGLSFLCDFDTDTSNEILDDVLYRIDVLIDPGVFRKVNELVMSPGTNSEIPNGTVEVLDACVIKSGDASLDVWAVKGPVGSGEKSTQKQEATAAGVVEESCIIVAKKQKCKFSEYLTGSGGGVQIIKDTADALTPPPPIVCIQPSLTSGLSAKTRETTIDTSKATHTPPLVPSEPPIILWKCLCCKKTFQKVGGWNSHITSKKHKKAIKTWMKKPGNKDKDFLATKLASIESIRDESLSPSRSTSLAASPGSGRPCRTCGGNFDSTAFRVHFRSDWHRYNLKAQAAGLVLVDENQFGMLKKSDIDAVYSIETQVKNI